MGSVLPNNHPTSAPPVSTVPPWRNSQQWILEYPFQSSREIGGLWFFDEPENEAISGSHFTDTTVDMLKARCEARLNSWQLLCTEDPTFLPRCIKQFRVRYFSLIASFSISHISL